MAAGVQHLHTYFLFPFSIDKQTVASHHPEIWSDDRHWIDGLDDWIAAHHLRSASPVVEGLGPWRRASATRFDVDSQAYQDMVFFHTFVRRAFFDTGGTGQEALLRSYKMHTAGAGKLWFEAEDAKGRRAAVEVTNLRLFLFANGIGILCIGVEAFGLSTADTLWINESLRKVYPSSGRQLREGRTPHRLTLAVERDGERRVLAEESFVAPELRGFLPPLASPITSLLYFADYQKEEFEPVLDERMIVYSYLALDPATLPLDFVSSEAYQVLLSRFLYVDREGSNYRYEPEFVQRLMDRQMYRRWAHQGTYYGFTSYSSITVTVGAFDCDEHVLLEGFLIHRMFESRYLLMALVALFYRATLLDFAERSALVSKRLYQDQEDHKLTLENIRLVNDLRAEFLLFANYWHFHELANKDEEIEHFTLQCRQYRIQSMKAEIGAEISKLETFLVHHLQFRHTEAVNRLAMLSLIMGAGAVLTGFFGMNFGRTFGRLFFEPQAGAAVVHYLTVGVVALLSLGALGFGVYVVAANWSDYRDIIAPRRQKGVKRG